MKRSRLLTRGCLFFGRILMKRRNGTLDVHLKIYCCISGMTKDNIPVRASCGCETFQLRRIRSFIPAVKEFRIIKM